MRGLGSGAGCGVQGLVCGAGPEQHRGHDVVPGGGGDVEWGGAVMVPAREIRLGDQQGVHQCHQLCGVGLTAMEPPRGNVERGRAVMPPRGVDVDLGMGQEEHGDCAMARLPRALHTGDTPTRLVEQGTLSVHHTRSQGRHVAAAF